MYFENALRKTGNYGPYQVLLFVILAFTALQSGMDLEFNIFMCYTPKYTCIDSVFTKAAGKLDTNLTAVRNQCSLFVNNGTNDTADTIPCSKWTYDQSQMKRTFITEFNLVCDSAYIATLAQTSLFAGLTLGMMLGGFGDHFGRRRLILIFATLEAAAMILTPFMPTVETIILFRFLRGLSSSLPSLGFTLISELVPMEQRAIYGINFWLFWSFGYLSMAGIGYFAPDWRHMKLYSCIPLTVYISFFLLVPESPRWLVLNRRTEEAVSVLKLVARRNGKKYPPDFFDNFVAPNQSKQIGTFLDLFRTQPMFLKVFISMLSETSIMLCYYGLSISSNFASDNIFLNIILLGLIEIPSGFCGWIISDKCGRKLSMSVILISLGLCLIAVPFVNTGWQKTSVALMGKFLVTLSSRLNPVYIAELLPTSVRSMGIFFLFSVGALATMLVPSINMLSGVAYWLPNTSYGAFNFISGLLVWALLPETKDAPMTQTVEEANKLVRGREREWIQGMMETVDLELLSDDCK